MVVSATQHTNRTSYGLPSRYLLHGLWPTTHSGLGTIMSPHKGLSLGSLCLLSPPPLTSEFLQYVRLLAFVFVLVTLMASLLLPVGVGVHLRRENLTELLHLATESTSQLPSHEVALPPPSSSTFSWLLHSASYPSEGPSSLSFAQTSHCPLLSSS